MVFESKNMCLVIFFINMALSFLTGYTEYSIKNDHTSAPNSYEMFT